LSFDKDARSDGSHGPNPPFPNDRGLLFICYVRSIEQQFEFVQQQWVNNPGKRDAIPLIGHELALRRSRHLQFSRPVWYSRVVLHFNQTSADSHSGK
jgi:hypothetical protein